MKRVSSVLLLMLGCTDAAVPVSPSSSTGMESTSATESSASGAMSSSGATASSSSSSEGGSPSSSSSAGETLDGPGCGVVPTCERRSISGNVRVSSVDDLSALEGAHELVGTLEIADSDLECLDALACLRIVGGDVRILGNDALRSTAGLRSIEALGTADFDNAAGSVVVSGNEALEVFEGFDGVRRIDGGVTVWQNPALREVAAFAGLRRLLLLSIAVNPALESLSGLHALEQLERCNVNSNATLCISEVFEVCGDLEVPPAGLTDNNDDGC